MANIIDYLLWRGDVPFSADPFNEVDALIFTELAYEDFSGIVPDTADAVALDRVAALFFTRHPAEETAARKDFTRQIPPLLELAGKSPRYAGTRLSNYHDDVDPACDMQLAIVSFLLPDGTVFVAYRGTDSTIIGWKEDFVLSYSPRTEGQRRAARYLNECWGEGDAPLLLGGHSKGGNLAMYAAAKCRPEVRKRIRAVYNNDGPGFLDAFIASRDYRRVVPLIQSTVPVGSVVGVLMRNEARQRVVESSASGLMQHDGFSWQVLGNHFVTRAQRNATSLRMEAAILEWLKMQTVENRRLLVKIVFGLLEATGLQTTHDLLANKSMLLSAMRKLQDNVPKEQRALALRMIGQFLSIGTGLTINDLKQELLARVPGLEARQSAEDADAPEPEPRAAPEEGTT